MELPRHLTVLNEPEAVIEQNSFELNEFIMKRMKQGISRKSSLGNKFVLTAEEVNRVRDKFVVEIDSAYEEAIRKHRGVPATAVPFWLWLVLLFFAFDNIVGYMASPILYYPFILIGSLLFCAWQLELLPVLIEVGVPKI